MAESKPITRFISIPQVAYLSKLGPITLDHAAILSYMVGFAGKAEQIVHDGKKYHWFAISQITRSLPMLGVIKDKGTPNAHLVTSKRKVRRLLSELIEFEAIQAHPENQTLAKSFYHISSAVWAVWEEKDFIKEVEHGNDVHLYTKTYRSDKPIHESVHPPIHESVHPPIHESVHYRELNDRKLNDRELKGRWPPFALPAFEDSEVWAAFKKFDVPSQNWISTINGKIPTADVADGFKEVVFKIFEYDKAKGGAYLKKRSSFAQIFNQFAKGHQWPADEMITQAWAEATNYHFGEKVEIDNREIKKLESIRGKLAKAYKDRKGETPSSEDLRTALAYFLKNVPKRFTKKPSDFAPALIDYEAERIIADLRQGKGSSKGNSNVSRMMQDYAERMKAKFQNQ